MSLMVLLTKSKQHQCPPSAGNAEILNKSQSRTRLVSSGSTSSSDGADSVEMPLCDDSIPSKVDVRRGSSLSSRRLAATAVLVSVLSLVGMAALAAYVFYDLSDCKRSTENEGVCVPCIQVTADPLGGSEPPAADLWLDTHLVGDTRMCCARTPAQYAAMFKLILKRQEAVKRLADILGPTGETAAGNNTLSDLTTKAATRKVASAHVLLDPKVSPSGEDKVQACISPKKSPLSHVRDVVYKENKLYVQREGMYFVYCQILYFQEKDDHHRYPALSSSYLKRRSLTYQASPGILLKARHTRPEGLEDHDRHSSYVAGLFYLHTGDELFVQVSTPELVAHDDVGNFFGLFKVD